MLLKLLCPHDQRPQSQWAGSPVGSRGSCPITSNASKRDTGTAAYCPQWDSTRGRNCLLLPTIFHDWSSQLEASYPFILRKTSGTSWSPRVHFPDSPPHLGGLSVASPHPVQCWGALMSCDRGLKMAPGQCPRGQLDVDNWAWKAPSEEEPHWDPNTKGKKNWLERYRQALLHGVKAGANKPTNMARTTEVLQKTRLKAWPTSMRGYMRPSGPSPLLILKPQRTNGW